MRSMSVLKWNGAQLQAAGAVERIDDPGVDALRVHAEVLFVAAPLFSRTQAASRCS
jgi:hypothetical protein